MATPKTEKALKRIEKQLHQIKWILLLTLIFFIFWAFGIFDFLLATFRITKYHIALTLFSVACAMGMAYLFLLLVEWIMRKDKRANESKIEKDILDAFEKERNENAS